MIRFTLRVFATILLAVAVIMAVIDATRSVAASRLVVTPLGTSWADTSPDTLEAFRGFLERSVSPLAWQLVTNRVLSLPGFVVFLVLSFLFYALGRRPQRRPRFAAEI
jgi:hypothetical protein